MECDRCSQTIQNGDQRTHLGQAFCEDCFMDALTPVRTCDPWATHCAKSFEMHNNDPAVLNAIQREILGILEKTGGLSPHELLGQLTGQVTRAGLEREFATLKHMDRVRAEQRGGGVFLRLC